MMILMCAVVVLLVLILGALVWLILSTEAVGISIAMHLLALIGAEQEQTAQFKAARETRELTREGRDLLRQRLAQRAKEAKH